MADKRLMPAGIRDLSTEALNELIDRLGSLDLTPLLIYIIDNVHASALPHLAWQFHVEGYGLTQTDAEKRSLIKKSLELHRYKGTPWAVKEAVKAVGYKDATLEERLPDVKYDGAYNYAGTEDYMGGVRWALFRVLIDIGETKSLTASDIQKLVALINEYKNARSHLKDITFKSTIEDRFDALVDSLSALISASCEDIKPWGLRYDGFISYDQAAQRAHDGLLQYNAQARYDEWANVGKRHDNECDVMDALLMAATASDEVNITPLYDGRLYYSGFTYGPDAPFAIDSAMLMTVIRHVTHDSRYNYGGIYYGGSFRHDSSKPYFGGIYYAGNIQSTEAVA